MVDTISHSIIQAGQSDRTDTIKLKARRFNRLFFLCCSKRKIRVDFVENHRVAGAESGALNAARAPLPSTVSEMQLDAG